MISQIGLLSHYMRCLFYQRNSLLILQSAIKKNHRRKVMPTMVILY